MIHIDYRIRRRGALFDASQSTMLMRRYARDTEEQTAEFAKNQVMLNLARSLRTRTPYYETQVAVRWRGGHPVVDDNRVVYGPWLEGVGSRNFPVTRFRGYASFRRANQATERAAGDIADRVWRRYAGRF